MTTSRSFPNAPCEVESARRFISETLAGVTPEAVEDTCLMVSELTTNCVRYTSTPFVVGVDHTPQGVRVEVTDNGGGEPVLQPLQFTEPGGRGLRIIQVLSDDWGVIFSAGPLGKIVWFSLALPKPSQVQRITLGAAS
jgi:anti-sigma regulatory factor (Ser/Thr protein kinase)